MPRAHTVLALLQLVDGREAEAIDSANRAVTVQPNDAEAFGNLALVLAHTGSREQAVAELEKALRLDPAPPPSFQLLAGVVLYTARENERAIPLLEAAREPCPMPSLRASIWPQPMLTAATSSAQSRKRPSCWCCFPTAI